MKYRQGQMDVPYLQVRQAAGHFRKSVMTAYLVPFCIPKNLGSI